MSPQGIEFINLLIQRKPKNRLGFNEGIRELRLHGWMIDFPWSELDQGIVRSPYKPFYAERDVGYGEKTDPEEYILLEKSGPPKQYSDTRNRPLILEDLADFLYDPIVFNKQIR